MTEPLHDPEWMADQIGKTSRWVLDNLGEIPHRRVGRSVRFSEADYRAYVESVARGPELMRTTGPRRRRAS